MIILKAEIFKLSFLMMFCINVKPNNSPIKMILSVLQIILNATDKQISQFFLEKKAMITKTRENADNVSGLDVINSLKSGFKITNKPTIKEKKTFRVRAKQKKYSAITADSAQNNEAKYTEYTASIPIA